MIYACAVISAGAADRRRFSTILGHSPPTTDHRPPTMKLGLIAGNGTFPFLVLDAARAQGYEVVVAAIKEEAFPEISSRGAASVQLLSLATRNTDSLLGAIATVLAEEGIMLENSTGLLEPLLAKSGVLTKRAPSEQERKNIEYGRAVGRRLAEYDIGQ